jgi:cell division protein FtsQ
MSDEVRTDPVEVEPVEVVVVPEASPTSVAEPVATARPPHMVSRARRRALMPWAVVASVLVVLGAGAIGLTYTPMFHAKTITVSGERRFSEPQILKMAGIGPGTDVFHVDLGSVERRLERNPWIAAAVVTRHLPSTISVVISERRAVALARSADGTLTYLALDGHVLAPARGTPRLPVVKTALDVSTDASAAATGAAVAQALPPALLPDVATISIGADGSVVLEMRSGVTATYGDGSQAELKGEALKAIVDYAANNGRALHSVDVSVPGAPTAVFADGAVASP